MKKLAVIFMTTTFLSIGLHAAAEDIEPAATTQEHPQQRPHKDMQRLTPEQKEAKKAEMKEKLKNMTPEERQKFRADRKAKWQERYDKATPEQQAKMNKRMEERKARRDEHRAKKEGAAPEGAMQKPNMH